MLRKYQKVENTEVVSKEASEEIRKTGKTLDNLDEVEHARLDDEGAPTRKGE
jgi:hypothetical protein